MRLLIKQRVFTWTDTYDVFDENENPKYYVKAEFLSLTHQIHVYECGSGQEVGAIHQKMFSFMPCFEVERNGNYIGRIQKKFSMFHPKYEIEYNGWSVEGDFMGWDYDVLCGNYAVMHITKELFHWGDTYVLDCANPADELLGLLLVIAIDAANCSGRD